MRYTLLLFALLLGCNVPPSETIDPNPPAEGFLLEQSDPQAIALADSVMAAMGGRKAWDDLRYVSWSFFGSREHLWDKHEHRVRIESERDSFIVLLNLETGDGKVQIGDTPQSHPDSLQKYLDLGKKLWINDSYWLFMPFKLKDSGVQLNYVREDTTQNGELSDVLSLRFEGVGVTPENKYEVYVDKNRKLITEWAFFQNANDSLPRFKRPWLEYQPYGDLFFSTSRGGDYSLEPIEVLDTVPAGIFENLTPN